MWNEEGHMANLTDRPAIAAFLQTLAGGGA